MQSFYVKQIYWHRPVHPKAKKQKSTVEAEMSSGDLFIELRIDNGVGF